MKTFESEIKKYAEKTRLKASEREVIRERVLSYMEYHPLPKKHDILNTSSTRVGGGEFIYFPKTSLRVKLFAGAFALVLIVGVPLAAERSVPGDVLYLVKTGVNEGIRTQLATSPYEKVALETKLMERRIGEARLLASEGKLTEEVEAQIVVTVRAHASAVQSGLAKIREGNADEGALAEIVFNSALEVQSAVLNESGKITDSSSVGGIIDVVNTVRSEVAGDTNPTVPSFEGLTGRIELETTRAYELFVTIKKSATEKEIRDIERRLTDIERKITEAKELRGKDETGAVNELVAGLGLIQKLIAFMTDIDIRETVSLETLVPVVFTQEERFAAVQKILDDVRALTTRVEAVMPTLLDKNMGKKIENSLEELATLVEDADTAIREGDINAAESITATARALIEDIHTITLPQEGEIPNPLGGEIPSTTSTTTIGTTTPIIEESTTTSSSTDEVVGTEPVE